MKKFLGEAFLWLLVALLIGFWFGLWQYIDWDTALALIIQLLK